jgi:hypothetical protein
MVDILHRVGVRSSLDHTYDAVATRDGLASWWANHTTHPEPHDVSLGGWG